MTETGPPPASGGESPEARLQALRARIRELDDKILSLAGERLQVAKEVGAVKLSAGLPIKDYQVEKEVLERARERARRFGLYESLAEDLARLMIRYAVNAQDEFHRQSRGKGTGPAKKILIIGGRGRMGRWLSEYFESFGHEVSHFDRAEPAGGRSPWPLATKLSDVASDADVIVLSTPIATTASLLAELTRLGPKALVFDICSLKTPLLEATEAAAKAGLRIASAHPMFGPGADVLAGRNILVCHVADAAATAEVKALWGGTTAHVWEVPLSRHDELMSYVLGLSHLTNLLFARALASSGVPFDDLAHAASTTFTAQLGVTTAVVRENPDLYFEIQAENAFSKRLLEALGEALSAYGGATLGKDRAAFKALMEESRRYLDRGGTPSP